MKYVIDDIGNVRQYYPLSQLIFIVLAYSKSVHCSDEYGIVMKKARAQRVKWQRSRAKVLIPPRKLIN